MAKKLIARDEYKLPQRGLHFKRGEVFEASDDLMLFLMADAPENFAVYTEPVAAAASTASLAAPETAKALDAPAVDKMVRRPKAKK